MTSLVAIAAWGFITFNSALPQGLAFLTLVRDELGPPLGSPSYHALISWYALFEHAAPAPFNTLVLVRHRNDNESYDVRLDGNVERLTWHLRDAVFHKFCHLDPHKAAVCVIDDLFAYHLLDDAHKAVESVWEGIYVSPERDSCVIAMSMRGAFSPPAYAPFQDFLSDEIASFLAEDDFGLTAEITGEPAMLLSALTSLVADIEKSDMYTLPIAWLVLAAFVGPSSLLVLVTLPASAFLAFWMMVPWAREFTFATFTPAIFVNILIAMSLDYALFLLSRYDEEAIRSDRDAPAIDAVCATMATAGRTVALSGAILAVAFLGLVFIDIEIIKTVGIGCALTVVAMLVSNLTLTPALLVVGGEARQFLSACSRRARKAATSISEGGGVGVSPAAVRRLRPVSFYDVVVDDEEEDEDGGGGKGGHMVMPVCEWARLRARRLLARMWDRVGTLCLRRPRTVMAGVALFVAPFGFQALRMRYSIGMEMIVPRTAPATIAMGTLRDDGLRAGMVGQLFWAMEAGKTTGAPPPAGLPPICHDDDVYFNHLSEVAAGIDFAAFLGNASGLGSDWGACAVADAFVDLCEITHFEYDGTVVYDVDQLADTYCPRTCGWCPTDTTPFEGDTVFSEAYFERQAEAIASAVLDESMGIDAAAFYAVAWPFGASLTFSDALKWLDPDRDPVAFTSDEGAVYRELVLSHTNNYYSSSIVEVFPRWNSYDTPSLDFVRGVRRINDKLAPEGATWFVFGGNFATVDVVTQVFDETPQMTAITVAVAVMLLTAVSFRSLMIGIRLLATIVITVAFVLGFGVCVFGDLLGLQYCWIVLVCAGPTLVGLTLDYDMFLLGRIYEYRLGGYSTEAATLKALRKTGNVITTAGTVMIVAFSALMLSSEVVLNQIGFVFVCASFVDTFIVRTLLVPAIILAAGDANWWPGKVPAVVHDVEKHGVDAGRPLAGDADVGDYGGDDDDEAGTVYPLDYSVVSLAPPCLGENELEDAGVMLSSSV